METRPANRTSLENSFQSLITHLVAPSNLSYGEEWSCMASDQQMSLKQVARWPWNLLLSREENMLNYRGEKLPHRVEA